MEYRSFFASDSTWQAVTKAGFRLLCYNLRTNIFMHEQTVETIEVMGGWICLFLFHCNAFVLFTKKLHKPLYVSARGREPRSSELRVHVVKNNT